MPTSDPTGLPQVTRLAAYALCRDAGRILLARIAQGYPGESLWTLPGGGLEFGEDPAAGVLRELEEETGLIGEVRSLAAVDSVTGTWDRPDGSVRFHWVRFLYDVDVVDGSLREERDGSTDCCAWFTGDDIGALPAVDLVQIGLRAMTGE